MGAGAPSRLSSETLTMFPRPRLAQVLTAPLAGLIVALKDVPDPAFAAGWLGDGIAIDPIDYQLRAPCPGTITRVARGGNAVEMVSFGGARILMHIGIDSHRCGCFAPVVTEGSKVAPGDTLIRFDPAELAGYLRFLIAKVIVLNAAEIGVTLLARGGAVQAGQPLLGLKRVAQVAKATQVANAPQAADAVGNDQCVCTRRQPAAVRA
jgi:glucose-specific phosphotransferase system IIA component